jgi:hypothetical protein
VAEWSKALDLGSSLSGGVGSNPTFVKLFLFFQTVCKHGRFTKMRHLFTEISKKVNFLRNSKRKLIFKDPPHAKHVPFRTAKISLSPLNFSKIFFSKNSWMMPGGHGHNHVPARFFISCATGS